MGQSTIYQNYDHIRRREVIRFGVIAAFAFLNIFISPYPLLQVFCVLIVLLFLVQVYRYLSHWDRRIIEKQLRVQGVSSELFENALKQGRFFSYKRNTDTIFVSGEYCVIGSREKYYIVRSGDILKLGLETISSGRYKAYRLNCLMRSGEKYSLFMGKLEAVEIAEYLKEAFT